MSACQQDSAMPYDSSVASCKQLLGRWMEMNNVKRSLALLCMR